jgi:hypothetical protein
MHSIHKRVGNHVKNLEDILSHHYHLNTSGVIDVRLLLVRRNREMHKTLWCVAVVLCLKTSGLGFCSMLVFSSMNLLNSL